MNFWGGRSFHFEWIGCLSNADTPDGGFTSEAHTSWKSSSCYMTVAHFELWLDGVFPFFIASLSWSTKSRVVFESWRVEIGISVCGLLNLTWAS